MKFDVITIGSATVDHFAETDSELIRIDTRSNHQEHIAFPLGGKLLIKELKTTLGGGGTNAAVAFAHLGLRTGYLGKIGSDTAGDMVVDLLSQEGIEFIGARDGQTGLSVILNSLSGDRTILAYKGANNYLRRTEIAEFDTKWLYLSSMLGESWDTVVELVVQSDYKIAFNPSNYQVEMGYKALSQIIERVSILITNREEACKLLGKDYHREFDVVPLLTELNALPPEMIVITDGGRGAYVYDGKEIYHGKPAAGITVVDATGAGDAFAATFTACAMLGKDIKTSLHYAMTNSESVLQHRGAKDKLLDWQQLVATAAVTNRDICFINPAKKTA